MYEQGGAEELEGVNNDAVRSVDRPFTITSHYSSLSHDVLLKGFDIIHRQLTHARVFMRFGNCASVGSPKVVLRTKYDT